MKRRFTDSHLERLLAERGDGGYPAGVARSFRKLVGYIDAAVDERDFYQMKSLHYEKLKGNRSHERTFRLNDQFRLVVRLQNEGTERIVVVVQIEDPHH